MGDCIQEIIVLSLLGWLQSAARYLSARLCYFFVSSCKTESSSLLIFLRVGRQNLPLVLVRLVIVFFLFSFLDKSGSGSSLGASPARLGSFSWAKELRLCSVESMTLLDFCLSNYSFSFRFFYYRFFVSFWCSNAFASYYYFRIFSYFYIF